jgi:hypothetical protein
MPSLRTRHSAAHATASPELGGDRTVVTPELPPPVDPTQGREIQVIFGATAQSFPLAGLQVDRARDLVASILRADGRTPVLVNGRPAEAGYQLRQGDVLELIHHAGEKGAL